MWRITRDARQSIKSLVVPYGPLRENVHDGYTAGNGIRSIRSPSAVTLLRFEPYAKIFASIHVRRPDFKRFFRGAFVRWGPFRSSCTHARANRRDAFVRY